jgi:hypothetical protein
MVLFRHDGLSVTMSFPSEVGFVRHRLVLLIAAPSEDVRMQCSTFEVMGESSRPRLYAGGAVALDMYEIFESNPFTILGN